jgi:streptogramin lyase
MKMFDQIVTGKFILFLTFVCGMIMIGCDKEVSRSPVETPPEGFVYVNSNPGGSTIFQNGRNTGRKTPDSLTFLEPGNYQITLKKNYFKDTSVTITVTEQEKSNINIDYLSNPTMFGNLALSSQPTGAAIFIDDSLLSIVTPDTIFHMIPGTYKIRLSTIEHRDAELDAIVQSSVTNAYSEVLRDTSVWIDYQIYNSDIQSNSLTAITVDNNNVKWIGTLQNGLIRYDEINFVNYNTTNSPIPSNKIQCIKSASNGDIWIGTNSGLAVFNSVSWMIYDQSNSGLTTNLINAVDFDNSGIAWIGTSSGLFRFDGTNWTRFNDPDLRLWVMDFKIDPNHKFWIGTKENGIVTLEAQTFNFYPDSIYNYPTERISSVDIDLDGNIWFSHMPDSAKRSGVSYWDGNMFINFYIGTVDNNVNHIFIDGLNNKWISSYQGFLRLDEQNISTFYTTFNSLISSNNINASVRDNNGNVWLTTQGGGLNKFKLNDVELK